MARFRRRTRPRIRWAWHGFSNSFLLSATGRTVVNIVSPTTFSTVADVTVERTLIDVQLHYAHNEGTPVLGGSIIIATVLTVVPTDANEDPITTAVPDPADGDVDTTQKRVMWTKWMTFPPLPPTSNAVSSCGTMGGWAFQESLSENDIIRNFDGMYNDGNPFDIGVRRKLGGDEALVLSLSATGLSGDDHFIQCDLYARALLRVGRK